MKTTKSYPAMHSNDTFWFAVDKEGKVGYFDTDSEGEIPVQGSFGNTFVDFFFHASKRGKDVFVTCLSLMSWHFISCKRWCKTVAIGTLFSASYN